MCMHAILGAQSLASQSGPPVITALSYAILLRGDTGTEIGFGCFYPRSWSSQIGVFRRS